MSEEKARKVFAKTAHLFAHRKTGVQKRFEKVYKQLAEEVQNSWLADLMKLEEEFKLTSKSNVALAGTLLKRKKTQASDQARKTMRTVYEEWRVEINRIVVSLGGYPQEDGNIIFPDGSSARMPKGLFIPEDMQLKFE